MQSSRERERLIVPAMAGVYERLSPWTYTIMRFAVGASLVPHGIQKVMSGSIVTYTNNIAGHGLPGATLLAYLVFFTESVAATCLAIGLGTRLAAAMIAVQMFVITFVFQWPNGYNWTSRGYEYPLLLGVLATAIFFKGGGPHSVDRAIGKEF